MDIDIGTVLGCSLAVVFGGLTFAAYKLGLLYQLFHKVGELICLAVYAYPMSSLSPCPADMNATPADLSLTWMNE